MATMGKMTSHRLLLLCVVCLICRWCSGDVGYVPSRPRAIIITGPESTDSTYVTRLIAHVMGVTTRGLHGGFAGNIGPFSHPNSSLYIMHFSQPTLNMAFKDLAGFRKVFDQVEGGCELSFVICTRDIEISRRSATRRFGEERQSLEIRSKVRHILEEIMETERFFIWNYETMVLLQNTYAKQLYKFLNVSTDFNIELGTKHVPPPRNGNFHYLQQPCNCSEEPQ